MTIETADRLVALLQGLQRDDVGALPPAERRRLLEALRSAHRIVDAEEIVANAKAATASQKEGLIAKLKGGERAE